MLLNPQAWDFLMMNAPSKFELTTFLATLQGFNHYTTTSRDEKK